MGTRRIPQDELLFEVSNFSSKPVVVGNRQINPGQTKDVPARYVVGKLDACRAMSRLMGSHIGVRVKFSQGGLAGAAIDQNYMLGLQAATAGVLGAQPVYATTEMPAVADVPVGFGAYDETLTKPQYSDGSAYKDGAGA